MTKSLTNISEGIYIDKSSIAATINKYNKNGRHDSKISKMLKNVKQENETTTYLTKLQCNYESIAVLIQKFRSQMHINTDTHSENVSEAVKK